MTCQIVWFKRDLRTHDNAALASAAAQGPVLCLYIIEPSYWRGADASQRQFDFLRECLRDLYRQLKTLNAQLHVVTGEVLDVLQRLRAHVPYSAIHSHEETGNALSYQRDTAVAHWCKAHGIVWQEYAQHGVVRRLKSRATWSTRWTTLMYAPTVELQPITCAQWHWPAETWPQWESWGQPVDLVVQRQLGGRHEGLSLLQSFLSERCDRYRGGISSPLSAPTACSRLSPYLSWGCLSMREVVQATQHAIEHLPKDAWARQGLTAFMSRLHWHCHFIQKLESEPDIEWRNMHTGYNGLREEDWSNEHFDRLRTGQTGWPLVDACVAMLKHTGWLNFRMRAMLVSVAAYPLWLHWKRVGDWLATQFIDYEPGIHWSQMQMQSGTTGINATRVYNPIKQAKDQDPQGFFVRQWLPVMRHVPDAWLFEPWKMPPNVQAACGVVVGKHWPRPIVELDVATRTAKARLHERRNLAPVKAGKPEVVEKHASRLRKTKQQRTQRSTASTPKKQRQVQTREQTQIGLDF